MDNFELLMTVLPLLFGLIFWVGLYVYMMLTIMRLDPREKNFRKEAGLKEGILP